MVRHCLLTAYPLAGFSKVKVQAISLEARLILADTVILLREEEEKKKQEEEPDGQRQPNPAEAEVRAQWATGLQASRVFNKR